MSNIKALVERIDALEKRATPGPWAWDQRGEKINEWGLGVAFDANDNPLIGRFDAEDATYVEQVCQTEGATVNYADADLICALRNAWPDLKAALAPLAEPEGCVVPRSFLEHARCPNCDGQGWYVIPNRNTGDAEQEQCQWCEERNAILSAAPPTDQPPKGAP